jgi:hypothetical protein
LIDHSGKPFTTRFLVNLLGISAANIRFDEDLGQGADIELILGADWARKIPTP